MLYKLVVKYAINGLLSFFASGNSVHDVIYLKVNTMGREFTVMSDTIRLLNVYRQWVTTYKLGYRILIYWGECPHINLTYSVILLLYILVPNDKMKKNRDGIN